MSYPYDNDAVQALFNSRGAQMYWNNWNTLRSWYGNYMLPEMLKSQLHIIAGECGESRNRKRKRKRGRKKKKMEPAVDTKSGTVHSASGMDEKIENRVEDMSPEFLEFYQKTLKHREELKKYRAEHGVPEDVQYAADDGGPEEKPTPSSAAPDVQAGTARTLELESLYGSSATKIQMLETQLQAKFDENRTRLQPKFWPVIPLNL